MSARVAWTEMEDGVLWSQTGTDIVAKEIAAGSPGERAGIQVGDVLLAIDGKALVSTDEIWAALHASTRGSVLTLFGACGMQGSSAAREHRGRSESRPARAVCTSPWRSSASSRCWSARPSGSGVRITRPRCISSG